MIEKVQKIREEVERIQLYTQSEVLKQVLDYIDEVQKEPVSEDFEEALAKEWKGYIDSGAVIVDALEDNTQELTFAKGFYRGAKWQKTKDESTTEDLGDYINELSKQFPEVSFAKLSRIAVRVAKWQKQQDQSTIELAEEHAYFAGRTKTIDEIKKTLLSEVLPCFMHGGEADEVVAKLDEVLNQKK